MIAAAPIVIAASPIDVCVRGLTKHYGETEAVRGIEFEVRRGEIFGLIGPDGAGKTTTFNVLAGILDVQSFGDRVDALVSM